jgi:hypothetical protein
LSSWERSGVFVLVGAERWFCPSGVFERVGAERCLCPRGSGAVVFVLVSRWTSGVFVLGSGAVVFVLVGAERRLCISVAVDERCL